MEVATPLPFVMWSAAATLSAPSQSGGMPPPIYADSSAQFRRDDDVIGQRLTCSAEVDAVVSVANAAAVAGGGAAGTFASGVLAAMAPTIAQFSTATIVAANATVGSNPRGELPESGNGTYGSTDHCPTGI